MVLGVLFLLDFRDYCDDSRLGELGRVSQKVVSHLLQPALIEHNHWAHLLDLGQIAINLDVFLHQIQAVYLHDFHDGLIY